MQVQEEVSSLPCLAQPPPPPLPTAYPTACLPFHFLSYVMCLKAGGREEEVLLPCVYGGRRPLGVAGVQVSVYNTKVQKGSGREREERGRRGREREV